MEIFVVFANEELPCAMAAASSLKKAMDIRHELKAANGKMEIKSFRVDKVPEFVFLVNFCYDDAGWELFHMLHLTTSEKRAKGMRKHFVQTGYSDEESIVVSSLYVQGNDNELEKSAI